MPDHDVFAKDALIADVLRVMHVLGPDGLPPSQEDNVRIMLGAYLPGPRQGDLFEEPPHEGNRLVKAAMALACGETDRHDLSLALAIKLAITIGHLRARRWDRLHAFEAQTVAEVLGTDVPRNVSGAARRVMATVVPHDIPAEFSFPWRPGNKRSGGLLGTSTSHVGLVEVDPVDVPVACSLWTPEERLDLRRLGAGWLRPVLSPGSWRPITVAEFREAARSGCAWCDNPFMSRLPRGLPAFHLLDVAGPQPLTAANARRTSEAQDACLVSAGHLHVIDGIVHRSTGAPTAGIGTTFFRGRSVNGPAWRVDGLASTQDAGTFGDVPVATWFNGVPTPDRSGSDDPDGGFVAWSDWIGVSSLLEAHGWRTGDTSTLCPPSVGDLVWSSEPLPSTPDVHGCLRVAAGMAMRLLPLAHLVECMGGHVGTCVRLKDALAAAEADLDGREDLEPPSLKLVRALCDEVLSLTWPTADPLGGMWTYVASLASYAVQHQSDPQLAEFQV